MFTQVSPFTYEHYRYILRSALERGYEFISFPALKDYSGGEFACLLRHDCDNDLTAAVTMARLEERLGVRSTYFVMLRSAMYNLMSIPNTELVSEIIQRGHWIGLHFDERLYRGATPAQVADYVDRERIWLSQEFGVPVEVVSFHQPAQRVLDGQIKINCVNTHDREYVKGIHYLSDSRMVLKEGCPASIFHKRKYSRLQLNLHPEWWTLEEMPVREKWNQMLQHNFELMQGSLLTREDAYPQRQEIEISLRAGAD